MDSEKQKTKNFIKYNDMSQHVSLQPESKNTCSNYIDTVVYSSAQHH